MTAGNLSRPNGRWLPLRFALRELRAGVRGFYVFIACIALGSMAIAGVGSLAASLADGLAREGLSSSVVADVLTDPTVHITWQQDPADPEQGEHSTSAGTQGWR